MVITLVLLLISHELNNVIGITAQRVLMRVFGILLAGIAVQAAFNGIRGSGLRVSGAPQKAPNPHAA